jgi:ribosomal protein L29
MRSVTPHKKSLKVEIMDEITEKLMEKLQDMVNQKVQNALRNIKTPQIKNLRRHRNN